MARSSVTVTKSKVKKVIWADEEEKFVCLTLTANEAQALMQLVACTGGSPYDSARKYITNICDALHEAGLTSSHVDYKKLFMHPGCIYFEKGSESLIENEAAEWSKRRDK